MKTIKPLSIALFSVFVFCLTTTNLKAQFGTSPWTAPTGTYTVPAGVTSLTIQCWGAGGGGGGASAGSCSWADGGGGGGGAFSTAVVSVIPGQTISVTVGAGGTAGTSGGGTGGAGNSSLVINNFTSTTVCSAVGGNGGGGGAGSGATGAGGAGGASGIGFLHNGGYGATPFTYNTSGGGGGGAGANGNGGNGAVPGGGAAGAGGGGAGGAGHTLAADGTIAGSAGTVPGGGGGGGVGSFTIGCGGGYGVGGGAGAAGKVVISYTVNNTPCSGTPNAATAFCTPGSAVCSGTSALYLSGFSSNVGINFQWYSSTDNVTFNIMPAATSIISQTPTINTTTYYYCISTCPNSGLSDTSTVTSFTISGTPPAGTADCSPTTIQCSGISGVFLAGYSNDPAITYQWYSSNDNVTFGLVAGATTTSFTTSVLTDTTYYYCQSTCSTSGQSAISTTTTVTVIQPPPVPGAITSNSPQCVGTGVVFNKGNCVSGTCYWESSATGTLTANSAPTYTTATTIGTYTVWVRAYNGYCWSAAVTASGSVVALPDTISIGTITQPTCTVATGSVMLNSLPASGSWTINPGNITGSGTDTTLTGLTPGTHNYTVTNASGCTSVASANVIINAQPITPSAPVVGTITQPGCTVATGSVALSGLPASGIWTINPGNITGTGPDTTLTGLASATYNYTVTNASGCTSTASTVIINPQPATPPTPVITQIGGVLHSSAASGNQWYNQATGPIGGATNQNYTITANGYYYVIVTVGGCSSDTSNIIHVTNAGIETNEAGRTLLIYPNPVSDEISIEIAGNKEMLVFEIVNSMGQVVFSGQVLEKTMVSTADFASGVYILKMANGKSFQCEKIIKE